MRLISMRRFLLVLVLAAAALVLPSPPPAAACSCMTSDVRERLPEVDGAFVGTLLSRDEPTPVDGVVRSDGLVRYRFSVERVVKGGIGSGEVDVWSSSSGASCGLETPVGQRTGLLLEHDGDRWTSNLCAQADPDVLIRAGRPLPPPPGTPPPAVLVGTTHGPGRMVSLDGQGRVIAYGTGHGNVTKIDFCPGGTDLVEVYTSPGEHSYYRPGVARRSTTDLTVVWERFLSSEEQPNYVAVDDVACADPDSGEVLALLVEERYTDSGEARREVRIVAYGRDVEPRLLWRGEGTTGTFTADGRAAFVNGGRDGRDLLRLDLATPTGATVRSLVRLPAGTGPLALSPDGRRLAGATTHLSGTAADTPPALKAVVVDLAPSPPAVTEAALAPNQGAYTTALWSGSDRVVFAPAWNGEPVRVFDPALTEVASWPGWGASQATIVSGRLVGLAGPEVITAPVTTGPATDWADLESGIPGTIATFPGGAPIGAAAQPPTTTTTAAPPAEVPGEQAVASLPGGDGDATGGRPLLAGGAGAALLAATAAGLVRRRRLPKLPQA
jgi:hypothetical protein